MKTAIITDTNSGISVQEGLENGIYVLPMPVIVDNNCYTEGIDITHNDLYDALESGKNVTTSQPSPADVTDLWEKALADGADEVVYIPMSSGLSNSCETAAQLATDYEGKVFVVNNRRISISQYKSVYNALEMAKEGKGGQEIKDILERDSGIASIYICVDTLKFLKKSSRVTAAGASLASALNLHPVLNIRGGKLDAQCVVRGEIHMQKTLIRLAEADMEKQFKDIPKEKLQVSTAGTFPNPEDAARWTERVQKAFPDFKVTYHPLSCSIACHVGCNTVAIAIAY